MNNLTDIARSRALLVALSLTVLSLVAACGGGDQDQAAPAHTSTGSGAAADASLGPATILAGVFYNPPTTWTDLGASGMRQAQYRLDPVAGDADTGEVNVFYFGPQSGGGTEANLQRWIGQMTLPDGGDAAAAAERRVMKAGGMDIHLVSLDGTYKSGGMRPMGGGGEAKPGYRLVGAVVEGPQGSLFFKLTGPVATAREMEKGLMAMLGSVSKAD